MTPTAALGALVAAPGAQPALPGSPGGASSGTGQEFLALVRALLGQGEAPTPTGAVPAGPAKPTRTSNTSDETDGSAATDGTDKACDEPGAATADPQVAVIDVPVMPAVPVALVQAITPIVTVPPWADTATAQPKAGTGDAGGTGDPAVAVAPVGHASPRGSHPAAAEALPTPAVDAPGTADAPSAPAKPEGPAAPTPASGAPAPAAPAAPTTVPSGLTPVTGPAPVSATAAGTTAPTQVTQQVFPEVVRIAGQGDGPRRLTLRLQPEFLGEVRVVMTSHKGELQISLAAGEAARHALTEGAPELRRLLESVGATDARIVIRDLPAGTLPSAAVRDVTPVATTVRTDIPTDLTGGPGSGTGRPGGDQAPDQQAHQRGSTSAMEGTLDAANPSRRTDSVTRARTAGLDVTM